MRILYLEDDSGDYLLVKRQLDADLPGTSIAWVRDSRQFESALREGNYDLILSDFAVPGAEGMSNLRTAQLLAPDTPLIVISGTIRENTAIEAVRVGAADYILKDNTKRLALAIETAVRANRLRQEKQEADREIRQQASMLDQAHDAIVITDLSGKITYWSSGAERVLGWTKPEAIGKTAGDLFGAGESAAIAEARQATRESGRWTGELRLTNRAGKKIILETRRTLVADEQGNPISHLAISTDRTETRQLAEQFYRAQRLENIGMLAAGIAHDLNNILAPIMLVAPLLKANARDPVDQRMIATLESSVARGAELVGQILSFAHGSTDQPIPLNAAPVIHELGAVLNETFPKSIQIKIDIPADLPQIQANSTHLQQILMNLAVNARDAMPQGGLLEIAAEFVWVDRAYQKHCPKARLGQFVRLTVKDTGTGIPAAQQDRVWEPFYTTKPAGKGTGLGLSTVRGLVQNHQGFVLLDSTEGKGTRFDLYFPAILVHPPAEGLEADAVIPPGSGELILVAEDEDEVRRLCSQILRQAGYEVLEAVDGAQASALVAAHRADLRLVLSDTSMPNLDGPGLGRLLRSTAGSPPIIAMSGLSEGSDGPSPGETSFGDVFLHKPFKPRTLLQLVHDMLSGKAPGNSRPNPVAAAMPSDIGG
jgi:PAS domain S-box-containing protein